jgi:phosphoglucosamine mutase
LLELGGSLGGENSGHYIFPDIVRCGDGLLAALEIARIMRDTGRPLSELRKEIALLPQLTVNVAVRVKTPLEELPVFGRVLHAAEAALVGRGRVMARYSGTEKKLRLLAEGPVRAELEKLLDSLRQAAEKELG